MSSNPPQQVLTVGELTAQIKDLLELSFPAIWVGGEISNLSRPQSGHWYFTLKDDTAQIRGVVWRSAAARLKFDLADGLDVVVQGRLDVYGPRGTYQLIAEQVVPRGVGALKLALRQLRDKLAAEGLFDPAAKRSLPAYPRRVAIVTSPTGAAIHDFLQVARRRSPGVHVLVIPTRVQGDGAAKEIAAAMDTANRLADAIDVLVVGRGGGSLEDLWAFNEESVVRAIAASRIPTVSAVGHEIDISLSDLAADVRALTPSEAAERVIPADEETRAVLRRIQQRLVAALENRARAMRQRLDAVANSRPFRRPLDRIHDHQRRLDDLDGRLTVTLRRFVESRRHRTDALAGKLESLSPLAVLARGYSITERLPHRNVVRSSGELSIGDKIETRLAEGSVVSRVEIP